MTTETIAASPEQSFALSMRTRERILGIASPIVLLVVWEAAARLQFHRHPLLSRAVERDRGA